jgi:D-psicose/D-tagatose/L-ribulose 3-epimerase
MKKQNYEMKNEKIKESFFKLKKEQPERFSRKLNLSWSNWGFGLEPLEDSVVRLKENGINFIELHGNHYGPDLGYQVEESLIGHNQEGRYVTLEPLGHGETPIL